MKILVIDTAAEYGGALSILMDLYNYVRSNDFENEWYFIVSGDYIKSHDRIHIIKKPEFKKNWYLRLWFEFFAGKKIVENIAPDVVLSLQNTMPFGIKAKKYLYIHQSLPFQEIKHFSFFKKSERKLAFYQNIIGRMIIISAQRVDHVFVQTVWMRKAVLRKTRISTDKVTSSFPFIEIPNIKNSEVCLKSNEFIVITSNEVYKNNSCVYDACNALRMRGITNFKVRMTLGKVESDIPQIELTGKLARNDVFDCYKTATLIFPSYIETFGYPLAEARAVGTFVFASDCPFSHEVLGDYINAYYFDPFQPEHLADLMESVIKNKLKLEPNDGCDRSKLESWSKILRVISSSEDR